MLSGILGQFGSAEYPARSLGEGGQDASLILLLPLLSDTKHPYVRWFVKWVNVLQYRYRRDVRHVETTSELEDKLTMSQLYKTFPRVSCQCKTRVTARSSPFMRHATVHRSPHHYII